MARYLQDPDATLDYSIDWSDWLADAETISSFTVVASTGVTVTTPTPSQSAGIVTVWLTAGVAGSTATVTCHIVTSAGRTDDREFQVLVRNR
jgi:hypothetical protein